MEHENNIGTDIPEDFKLTKPEPKEFRMTNSYSDKESNIGTVKNNIALSSLLSEDPINSYQKDLQQYVIDSTKKGYEAKAEELYASQKGARIESFWDGVASGDIPAEEVADRLSKLHSIDKSRFKLPLSILQEMSDKNMLSKRDLSTTDGIYTAFSSSVDAMVELNQSVNNNIATKSATSSAGLYLELFEGTALEFMPTNELRILRDMQEEFKDDIPKQNEMFSIWVLDYRESMAESLKKMPFPQMLAMKKMFAESYLEKSGILVDNPYQTVQYLEELDKLALSGSPEFADRMIDYIFQTIDHVEEARITAKALKISGKAVGKAFSSVGRVLDSSIAGKAARGVKRLLGSAKAAEASRFATSPESRLSHWSDYSRERNAEFKTDIEAVDEAPIVISSGNKLNRPTDKPSQITTAVSDGDSVPFLQEDIDEVILRGISEYISGVPQPTSPMGLARISNPNIVDDLENAASSSEEAAEVLSGSRGNDRNYTVDYPEWNTGARGSSDTGRIDGGVLSPHSSLTRASRDLRQMVGIDNSPQGGINFTVDEVNRAKDNIELLFEATPTAVYSKSASKIDNDGDTLSIRAVFLKDRDTPYTNIEEIKEVILAMETRFPRVDGEFSIGIANGDGTYAPLNMQDFTTFEEGSVIPMNDYVAIWEEKTNVNPSDLNPKDWDNFSLTGTVFDRNNLTEGKVTQNILDPSTFLDPQSYKAGLRAVHKEQALQHRFNTKVDDMDKIRRKFTAEQDQEIAKYLRNANLTGVVKSTSDLIEDGFSPPMVEYAQKFAAFWDDIWYLENKNTIVKHRVQGNNFIQVNKLDEEGFLILDYKVIGRPVQASDLNVGGNSSPRIVDLTDMGPDLVVTSIKFKDPDGNDIPDAVANFTNELDLQNKVIYKLSEPLTITKEGKQPVSYMYAISTEDDILPIRSTDVLIPSTPGGYTTIYTDPYFMTKEVRIRDKRTGKIITQVEEPIAIQSAPYSRTIRDKYRAITGNSKASISTPEETVETLDDPNLELVTTHKVITNVNTASKRAKLIDQINTNVNSINGGKLFDTNQTGVPNISANLRANIFDSGAILSPVDAMLTAIGDLGSKGDTRAYLNSVESRWINQFGDLTDGKYPTDASQINLAGSEATKHVADAKAMFNYVQTIKMSAMSEVDEFFSAQIRTLANTNESSIIINKSLLYASDYQIVSRGKKFASEVQLILHPLRRWGMAAADISRIWAINPANPLKTAGAVTDITLIIASMVGRMAGFEAGSSSGRRLLAEIEKSGLISGIDKNFLIESGLRDNFRSSDQSGGDLGSRTLNVSRLKNSLNTPSKAVKSVASGINPMVTSDTLSSVVKYAGQVPSEWLQLVSAYMAFRWNIVGNSKEITKEQLEQVSALASNFSFAMNRAGTLNYNEGMLSPVMQYFAVLHKGTLQVFGGLGNGEGFTSTGNFLLGRGGNRQDPNASKGRGTKGRPILSSSQRTSLGLWSVFLAGGAGIMLDNQIDTTTKELLKDGSMSEEEIQSVSDSMTMGGIVYLIQAIEDSETKTELNFNDVIQLDTDMFYKGFVLASSTAKGDSEAVGKLFTNSPIAQSYGKIVNIAVDVYNITQAEEGEFEARAQAVVELYAKISSGYSAYTRAKVALKYHKVLSSKGATTDVFVTTAESYAVALGFKTMDEARLLASSKEQVEISKNIREDTKKWYEDYKRIFLDDVTTDLVEQENKLKTMKAAAEAFKDQMPIREVILSYIINDINNGDDRLIAQIFKNRGFLLNDDVLPTSILNAIQDPQKRSSLEAMFRDMKLMQTYIQNPELRIKEEREFNSNVDKDRGLVEKLAKDIRKSKKVTRTDGPKDTSVKDSDAKFRENVEGKKDLVDKLLRQIRSKKQKGAK